MPRDSAPPLTDDAFLGGRLRVLQPRDGYRAGLDAVLLAATVRAAPEAGVLRIVDAGAGVGVVGLCVALRLADARVVLVEREPVLVDLARRNVALNGLSARIEVVAGDVTGPSGRFDATAAGRETATHVLANPPFTPTGRGSASPKDLKAAAHQMADHDLDRWGRFLAYVAAPGATATMIHRADALPAVLAALDGRFGALGVLPIHARAGETAMRVIVSGVKGSRAPLSIKPGLVLHGDDRSFRPGIEAVLRHGAPLDV